MSFNFAVCQYTNNQIRTIVIDAGHGGHDPGNLGTKRYKKTEKHIALDISLKLGEYIQKEFPDINILYTRKSNDQFLELWERTELANSNNADLFISIHCDAFTNSNACGPSVYVMGMSKLKANMDIAMKENAVIYLEDDYKEKYDGFDPNTPESYIVFSLTQNTFLEQSLKIAQEIDYQFENRKKNHPDDLVDAGCSVNSRGVKQAPFYVISRANMPSILVEVGFLTNPNEEDYLHSEAGHEYISSAIFRAFMEYKNSVEQISSSKEKDVHQNVVVLDTVNMIDSVIYKIQIGIYLNSMLGSDIMEGLNVEEEYINGTYKYFTFGTSDKNKADQRKQELRSSLFPGAFIVAFYQGKQISVKEALNLQNK